MRQESNSTPMVQNLACIPSTSYLNNTEIRVQKIIYNLNHVNPTRKLLGLKLIGILCITVHFQKSHGVFKQSYVKNVG